MKFKKFKINITEAKCFQQNYPKDESVTSRRMM